MSDAVTLQSSPALDLESLAADVVKQAMRAVATDAEVVVREGDEFSVNVRMGEVETLKESGSRALGLRVYMGKRTGSASTSDLTLDGIRQAVEGAVALKQEAQHDLSPTEKLEALQWSKAGSTAAAVAPSKAERRAEAKAKGYEGEMCSECGNFTLVRNGTCMKCDTCGSTTGCS